MSSNKTERLNRIGVEASHIAERSFSRRNTVLDTAKGVVLLEESERLGWPTLHAAIVEKEPIERQHVASCLWIDMSLSETDCEFRFDGRKEKHKMPAGMISLLPPGMPLSTRLSVPTRALDVSIEANLLGEVAGELFDCSADIEIIPQFGAICPSLASLMYAVKWTLREPVYHSILKIEYLTRALAADVLAKHAVERKRPFVADCGSKLSCRQLQRVLEYIEQNLSRDLSLNELATIAGVSKTIFVYRFKNSMKETPHRYLIRARVRRGQELLVRSKMPIADIAVICGFADHAHFTSVFKRIMGNTPSAYRKICG
ncbi:AraC family transcriptional regulator [Rhizobium sp. BK312]|uniref:helix-turn-helix domain-containing protein n=1 Tax=Rhizobium sp. BK312 TaxID=2587080 RepID=UPI0013AF6C2C|nr:AraC family transcriptional regulator [Rhizobium sp. BK312]MBB3424524.1 AraC family transcriptional regulator [Rhizobium sp. BK312]